MVGYVNQETVHKHKQILHGDDDGPQTSCQGWKGRIKDSTRNKYAGQNDQCNDWKKT